MPRHLHVYDFDGTLVRTPTDTPENRCEYEEITGIPWIIDKTTARELTAKHRRFIGIRKGWWGRAETLEPPLVPDPVPPGFLIIQTAEALAHSRSDEDVLPILMTGRHAGIKNQVLRICHQLQLFDIGTKVAKSGERFYQNQDHRVQCYFMGDVGPAPKGTKPTSTFPWKVWIINQFVRIYPELEEIQIWEDREEHVKGFRELGLTQQVVINHVSG